jgi:DNA modification methylase
MAVIDSKFTDNYAIYNGDSCEVLPSLPSSSVGLSVYSPPFGQKSGGALYHYSSSARDLSNARTYNEFFTHYEFIVRELLRATMPGRSSAVHCCDVPSGNSGVDKLTDFPGDIIRMHEAVGWDFVGRYFIWKEPLGVRNRTMQHNLAHKSVVDDSAYCGNAGADQLLLFRKPGENPQPITHPNGFLEYVGEEKMPDDLLKFRGWSGDQKLNKFSHWIWRRYASSHWLDIRGDRVLPFRDAREPDDEKHVHPLQLDVIERAVALWSNPGDAVVSPFAGVGSEVYGAVINGRRGIGIELKSSYYKQALRNLEEAEKILAGSRATGDRQVTMFGA